LERDFSQKQVDLEATLATKLQQRQAEMDSTAAQADAERLQLTTQLKDVAALQAAIETSRTGLNARQEKLNVDNAALAERKQKFEAARGAILRQVGEMKAALDQRRAPLQESELELDRTHEAVIAENRQAYRTHQKEMEELLARCMAANQDAQRHETIARRAEDMPERHATNA